MRRHLLALTLTGCVSLLVIVSVFMLRKDNLMKETLMSATALATGREARGLTTADTASQIRVFEMENEQKIRRQRIQDVCSRHKIEGTVKLLYKYNTTNVSYCSNHKSASTYWMQVYRFLHGDYPDNVKKPSDISKFHTHLGSMRRLKKRDYTIPQDHDDVMQSYRFMVARDPYQRLWSVYVDKYVMFDNYFWSSYSKKIREGFLSGYDMTNQFWQANDFAVGRDHLRNAEKKTTTTAHSEFAPNNPSKKKNVKKKLPCIQLSFEEFLFDVAKTGKANLQWMDDHVIPIHASCNPCLFQPDFVGKVETLTHEKGFLLEKLGLPPDVDSVSSFQEHVLYEMRTGAQFQFDLSSLSLKFDCLDLKNLQMRTLSAFIINGYLPKETFTEIQHLLPLKKEIFIQKVTDTFMKLNRTSKDVSEQRVQMRTDAYRKIPYQTLLSLQEIFKFDFILFDYDPKPGYIFDNRINPELGYILNQ